MTKEIRKQFKDTLKDYATKIKELKILYKSSQKELSSLHKEYGHYCDVKRHCNDPRFSHPFYSKGLNLLDINYYNRNRFNSNLIKLQHQYRHLHICYCLARNVEYSRIESNPKKAVDWSLINQYKDQYGERK